MYTSKINHYNDFINLYNDSIFYIATKSVVVNITGGNPGYAEYTLPDDTLSGYSIISVLGIRTTTTTTMRIAGWMVSDRTLYFVISHMKDWTGTLDVHYTVRLLMYKTDKVRYN